VRVVAVVLLRTLKARAEQSSLLQAAAVAELVEQITETTQLEIFGAPAEEAQHILVETELVVPVDNQTSTTHQVVAAAAAVLSAVALVYSILASFLLLHTRAGQTVVTLEQAAMA